MFGFFMFGQSLFADVPRLAIGPGGGGGGTEYGHPEDDTSRRNLEIQIEITLLAFLNTQR